MTNKPLHYKGEIWYLVKVKTTKRIYRNQTSTHILTINYVTGQWTVKRIMPKVRRYGKLPNAWAYDPYWFPNTKEV